MSSHPVWWCRKSWLARNEYQGGVLQSIGEWRRQRIAENNDVIAKKDSASISFLRYGTPSGVWNMASWSVQSCSGCDMCHAWRWWVLWWCRKSSLVWNEDQGGKLQSIIEWRCQRIAESQRRRYAKRDSASNGSLHCATLSKVWNTDGWNVQSCSGSGTCHSHRVHCAGSSFDHPHGFFLFVLAITGWQNVTVGFSRKYCLKVQIMHWRYFTL